MKYHYKLSLTLLIIIFSGCSQKPNTDDPANSSLPETDSNSVRQEVETAQAEIQTEPTSVAAGDYENPKLTLLTTIKYEPFNPNGYRLFRKGDMDEYGNRGPQEDLLIVTLTEEQVNEVKAQNDLYDFWDTNYGQLLVNRMIDCFQKKTINCDCKDIKIVQ